MRRLPSVIIPITMLAALLTFAACGDDDAGATNVDVSLQEFAVLPDTDSVSAGEIIFRASNTGPNREHELVIIRSDLAPDALPTEDDGSVSEDEVDIAGKIEPFPVDSTEETIVNLPAGNYVLICNIAEVVEGGIDAHYTLGMRTAFGVE